MDRTVITKRSLRLSTVLFLLVFSFASQAVYADASNAAPEPAVLTAAPPSERISTYPFAHIAFGVTAGTLGGGAEVVTTISRRTNLRVDGHFLNFSHNLTQDGVAYAGNLRMRDARASYDIYPFGGGFRVSAGVAMYNKVNATAVASVPAGQSLTFNDVPYYSSTTDPLGGNATLGYNNKIAPTVTFGWGNAIPRSGRHLAFPIEIGAAYTGTPTFNLAMTGSACATQDPSTCMPVNNFPSFQSNLTVERNKINNDLAPARFYPIINAGMTYRF